MQFLERFKKKFIGWETAQNVVEYTVLLTLIMAGIITAGPYVVRSWNANLKGWEDSAVDSLQDPLLHGPSVPLAGCDPDPWQDGACGGNLQESCGRGNVRCLETQRISSQRWSPSGCECALRGGPPQTIQCTYDDCCCETPTLTGSSGSPICGVNATRPQGGDISCRPDLTPKNFTNNVWSCPNGFAEALTRCGTDPSPRYGCIAHPSCSFRCTSPPSKPLNDAAYERLYCQGDDINLPSNVSNSFVDKGSCSPPTGPKCETECIPPFVANSAGDVCDCPSGTIRNGDTCESAGTLGFIAPSERDRGYFPDSSLAGRIRNDIPCRKGRGTTIVPQVTIVQPPNTTREYVFSADVHVSRDSGVCDRFYSRFSVTTNAVGAQTVTGFTPTVWPLSSGGTVDVPANIKIWDDDFYGAVTRLTDTLAMWRYPVEPVGALVANYPDQVIRFRNGVIDHGMTNIQLHYAFRVDPPDNIGPWINAPADSYRRVVNNRTVPGVCNWRLNSNIPADNCMPSFLPNGNQYRQFSCQNDYGCAGCIGGLCCPWDCTDIVCTDNFVNNTATFSQYDVQCNNVGDLSTPVSSDTCNGNPHAPYICPAFTNNPPCNDIDRSYNRYRVVDCN